MTGYRPLTVYHYPSCSTCKKALAWLAKNGYGVELLDIVKQPPSRGTLEHAAKLGKLNVRKLFNVSGVSYREGDFKTKLPTMTETQAFAALAADGKLIKRPLLISQQTALVGFDETEWRHALDS